MTLESQLELATTAAGNQGKVAAALELQSFNSLKIELNSAYQADVKFNLWHLFAIRGHCAAVERELDVNYGRVGDGLSASERRVAP